MEFLEELYPLVEYPLELRDDLEPPRILLEGCELLNSSGIPINRGKLAWKRGSNIECDMLNFHNGELEEIRTQNVCHARKLLLGCVSQERSVPVVSAAVDSFDFQRCSGGFVNS